MLICNSVINLRGRILSPASTSPPPTRRDVLRGACTLPLDICPGTCTACAWDRTKRRPGMKRGVWMVRVPGRWFDTQSCSSLCPPDYGSLDHCSISALPHTSAEIHALLTRLSTLLHRILPRLAWWLCSVPSSQSLRPSQGVTSGT
jgi:hypothetical protein